MIPPIYIKNRVGNITIDFTSLGFYLATFENVGIAADHSNCITKVGSK